jgi:peptidoglycan glycosyltransferase
MSSLPPGVARRRRLVTRMLPLAAVAVVAFVAGAVVGAPGSPGREAAARFAEAWARRDFAAMYGELNEASRRAIPAGDFAAAYREAAETATLRGLDPGEAAEAGTVDGATRVRVPVAVATAAFGSLRPVLALTYADGGIVWGPRLVFPGLRSGEHLENEVLLAERAPILARDGSALAEGPARARRRPLGRAAIDVTGEIGLAASEALELLARQGFPPDTLVGTSGLERAFNRRLAGRPGGLLLAVSDSGGGARILARGEPRRGAPLKTTIDPDLQVAAVAALAGRLGGVAALDARRGDVRALAGQAFSAPQPPGSTFKIVTTVAALQRGVVALDDYFPIVDGVNVGGRFINNANGEYCGGSFREAFAHSCNADFAPLGPKIGNDALVAAAERFGFNAPPTLYAEDRVRELELPESTIPAEIGADIDLGVSAIGQGEVLATPLAMASVAQAIAGGGVRRPTSIVANRKLRPEAGPVRVASRKIAAQLTELMVGVVAGGTGYAGAIAEAQVAGKTGTAELGPKPGQEDSDNPVQVKDAWFAAFAPAETPRLAVAVLLVEAEASGGEVAAPAAAAVLSAGL